MTGAGAPIAGLLHTVGALTATFDGLIRATGADVRPIHIVDGWLLDTVRREGITREVVDAVVRHAEHLGSLGARAVLVTCSSIGEVAEAADRQLPLPVLRVDQAMADEAIRIASEVDPAGQVAVLATLPSTLRPTSLLVRRAGMVARREIEVTAQLVEGAAEAHDRGDRQRVSELVAAAVAGAAAGAGVIVLAQASMAAAAELVDVAVPVLSSPAGGVKLLLDALAAPVGSRQEPR